MVTLDCAKEDETVANAANAIRVFFIWEVLQGLTRAPVPVFASLQTSRTLSQPPSRKLGIFHQRSDRSAKKILRMQGFMLLGYNKRAKLLVMNADALILAADSALRTLFAERLGPRLSHLWPLPPMGTAWVPRWKRLQHCLNSPMQRSLCQPHWCASIMWERCAPKPCTQGRPWPPKTQPSSAS